MRLNEIIKENQNLTKEYDVIINETTSKFWETLIEMHGKPLSESYIQDEIKSLEGMLFETGLFLPDAERERFFRELTEPTYLNEGVMDFAKKAGAKLATGIAKTQDAIDAGKKAIAGAVFKSVKYVWKNFIPQSVKDMGTATAEKVGKILGKMIEKAGSVLKKLASKLEILGKKDPCYAGTTNESELAAMETILNEARENLYFTGDKAGILIDNKDSFTSLDISSKAAKAIAMTKAKGIEVFGRDFRSILHDVYLTLENKPNEAQQVIGNGLNDPMSMSKWFKDNSMKIKIKQFENEANPQVDTESGASYCEIQPGFIDKYLGSDSEIGKAWTKLGLDKESALGGMISKLSENKTSLLITLASLVMTFSSGAGALRIAGLVFSSVIPLLITARIDNLKEKGAPEDQIAFWEKARSISKFVNTIIQIFNIGNLISKGWSFVTDMEAADLDHADTVLDGATMGAGHGFDDLSDEAKNVLNKWTANDGNYELSPKTVNAFFNDVAPKMSEEQFAKFNELAASTKNYNELVKILDNPTGNGIIDVDTTGAIATVADQATDFVADLSDQTNISQSEFLKATGMSYDDLSDAKDGAMIDYAKDQLGVTSFKTIQGIPMTDEEYAEFLKAVPTYEENPMSKEALAYLGDEFGDRRETVLKMAYADMAEEASVKMPTQYNIGDEVTLPTDYDSADEIRNNYGETVPTYSDFASENMTTDQVRKLYYALGEDEAQMKEITDLVKAGKLTGEQVDGLIDAGVTTGQTPAQLHSGIIAASETNAADVTTATDVEPKVDTKPTDVETTNTKTTPVEDTTTTNTETTPPVEDATAALTAFGKELSGTEAMGKLVGSPFEEKVGNELMKLYSKDPEFVKAWNSPGFDKEGFVEMMASKQGWFEPINQDGLIQNMKDIGVDSPEVAQKIGTHVTNSYDGDAAFRAKWNAMNDAQQEEYLKTLKAEVDAGIANEKMAAEIVASEPLAAELSSSERVYLDGQLKTNPELAKSWETMDETAKQTVIEKAKYSAVFQQQAQIEPTKQFQLGVDLTGNDYMAVGSAAKDAGITPEGMEVIKKFSNINYGENSINFRKALKMALESGDQTNVQNVLSAAAAKDTASLAVLAKQFK